MTAPAHTRLPSRDLTDRETQVAILLAAGERPTAIAKALQIDIATVSSYMRRACEKLGLVSRHQLAAYAKQAGLS